jgi:hypothetical protein
MRALRILGFAAALVLILGIGPLIISNRSSGVKGVILYPDCQKPVVTTPCETNWTPLKAKIRIFGTVARPDGTSYPGPLFTTSESTADGRFEVRLRSGKYFVSASAIRDNLNSWESEPMLIVIMRWSFDEIRVEARAVPGAQ